MLFYHLMMCVYSILASVLRLLPSEIGEVQRSLLRPALNLVLLFHM